MVLHRCSNVGALKGLKEKKRGLMNGNGTAQMYLPNGEAMNVTLDAQGVAAARQATMINTYYAAR